MRWNAALRPKFWLAVGLAAAVAGGVLIRTTGGPRRHDPAYTTALAQRGELVATVVATGTVEPEEVVDVGAQVVGIVQEFGRDPRDAARPVDYGTQVEDGTILARIDDAVYRARADKAAAHVAQMKAEVARAEADGYRAEANAKEAAARRTQAARDWARVRAAFDSGSASQQDYDAARSAEDVTAAGVEVAQAAVRQAKAAQNAAEKTAAAAEAEEREAKRNLDYTVIRSPVRGVIIDRRVNVGQTVVSSLNAPSLFLIAKDLRRLQVWASVNEADVGRVRPRQPVRFTVDAYPGEEFRGEVAQVRLNATMTQNVVTYTVAVTADNPDGKLLPYLTANLRFETGRRPDALLVPNAALRWQPAGQPAAAHAADRGVVWVDAPGGPRRVEVRTGLTDGVSTEVVEGALRAGDPVVVGEPVRAEAGATTSPFTPNVFGGKR
ncbi:MAG: efflux RND transporter periplasmic adaptor subunit [Gemmataceae bacterium]